MVIVEMTKNRALGLLNRSDLKVMYSDTKTNEQHSFK